MSFIIGANSAVAGGFSIDNSCRLDNPRDGASSPDYLTRTPSGATNQKTFTISYWVKRSGLQTGTSWQQVIGQQASNYFRCGFNSNEQGDIIRMYGPSFEFRTTAFYRDVSAWYHVVLAMDTTQAVEANRAKLYVNGTQVTSFVTETIPGQNVDQDWNVAAAIVIGRSGSSGNDGLPAYLAQFVNIDGTAYAASDFGEFDEDSPTIWKPIDVSGLTFGTNGFFLDFADAADLGDDESGNTNDFAETGITATNQSTDTPTNNFATMNPLLYRLDSGVALVTYTEGNLKTAFTDGSAGTSTMSTIGVTTGKWYWEAKATAVNDTCFVGITRAEYDPNDNFAGESIYYNSSSGALSVGTGTGGSADGSYGNTWATGDIMGVAFDATNGVIWFSKNGTWQNSATIGEIGAGTTTNAATTGITMGQIWMAFGEGTNETLEFNFGNPTFSISSANADGNGYGSFEYPVPTNYYALNTKNLAEYG